jgi:hypothetical protein
MGGRDPEMTRARRQQAERSRGMTAISGVMASITFLVMVQFLLLMVAVDGFMAGRASVLVPSAAGSGFCFAASCWLLRYISGRVQKARETE